MQPTLAVAIVRNHCLRSFRDAGCACGCGLSHVFLSGLSKACNCRETVFDLICLGSFTCNLRFGKGRGGCVLAFQSAVAPSAPFL